MNWHYQVRNNADETILLDSTIREDFNGYSSEAKALEAANNSCMDNSVNMFKHNILIFQPK